MPFTSTFTSFYSADVAHKWGNVKILIYHQRINNMDMKYRERELQDHLKLRADVAMTDRKKCFFLPDMTTSALN